ncbi:Uncharacterized protein PECH_003298 [Penicillium ucsense]|uniref:NOT2/NOT3/NOT5 C-terminal domain-containing protein n=1 Tax=Penicillium ucsense TaxID=2839758 RepID=A0A8J8WEI8_9EURO|nr:Uncharacterized protein PECM_002912 [Penicillium ucsense]KAF7729597.1 Uncharacterized protein PECH_003298 [Penicillium ucsense]
MSGLPAPQQAQARNTTLATGRLPNGKIGGAANWNFNLPGTSSLQGNQQRTLGTMGSFAQSLGGSQPSSALDLSEFPSLSGTSQQSQSQNPVWANASQRAAQHTPVQRQQHPPTSQPPSRNSQSQQLLNQQSSQASHDDMLPSAAQFANRLDDFRNGGQGISSQLGNGSQPRTGNIDEFPPLGRNVGNVGNVAAELVQERRASAMQAPGFGAYNSGIGSSRSPVSQGANGTLAQDKDDLTNVLMSGQRNFSDPQLLQQRQEQGSEVQEPTAGMQSAEQPPLAQMSELDRFGLSGLLRMIHSESADVASLAVGQDLMTLGLDLNQPEPLHTSFASPFVSSMSAVPLEQDFALPACYNVANIQPLSSRIPGFSDETLFYIFYSMPRDIIQELVAEELMGRKWRYHKLERCWLTRDESYPGPVDVERGVSERGVYLLWDHTSWKKIRREFILRYEDLDNRLDASRTVTRAAAGQSLAS